MAWDKEQRANARTIIAVGNDMGMSRRDIQIALMTAMQESTLRNLNYGDRDSLGLFQQRPSQGWGTASQVTDPVYASRKFYSTLKGVKNRDSMSLTRAAQAVQRSAFPDAYAKWADDAAGLLGKGAGVSDVETISGTQTLTQTVKLPKSELKVDLAAPVTEDTPFQNVSANDGATGAVATGAPAGVAAPEAIDDTGDISAALYSPLTGAQAPTAGQMSLERQVVEGGQVKFGETPTYSITYDQDKTLTTTTTAGGRGGGDLGGLTGDPAGVVGWARKALGTPYVWGGNSIGRGLDCSGLVQQAFKSIGISLPRLAQDQMNAGRRIGRKDLRPGDLVAWDYSSRFSGAEHIAIYIGGGKIIEAPRPGRSVQISSLYNVGSAKPYFARVLK